ncbi:MAG: hypothetical protein ACYDA6_03365 [Solirubrobacteraceae bacterium]
MDVATGKIAKNMERFAQALAQHARENPTHTAYGIGLSYFDLERLSLEEGEEILPGITVQVDGGVSGNFRILCDGLHNDEEEDEEAVEEQVVVAIMAPQGPPSTPDPEDPGWAPAHG